MARRIDAVARQARFATGRSPALRALVWFWAGVLLAGAGGAGALQLLGPPAPSGAEAASMPASVAEAPGNKLNDVAPPVPAPPTAGLDTAEASPGKPVIAAPDPALLEPSKVYLGGVLPRVGPGGRTPMRAYAAPFDAGATGGRPLVAVLLSGIGMSETDSEEAIHLTPPAVSLAVSPYAFRPERILADARATGHEVLLSIPMEPERYPLDDAGNRALLTGSAPMVNQQRLEWALTRFAGYVGATAALGDLHGERFTAAPELMAPVLRELAGRGLLYVDPRVGAPPPAAKTSATPAIAARGVDVLIDAPAPVRSEIEANLARLEQVAKDRGAALGLVSMPRPVTLDRIAAWANQLNARGLVLAPVSALVALPTGVAAK